MGVLLYLARLSLQGFKSFAERTTLEFEPGITGIVGPNGSGKSNIADAIRWILGEQRIKNLRGSKLEDVVFAGSQGSKPVGMAEVTMTLDNSDGRLNLDYNEIVISRRVYRSGESEFFINNNPCRLRDIQELFMDTGVGRDAFCVLGQQDIDTILSPNSEDRKRFIEEAAGVVKFRIRKQEAQRKLAETETNLVRLADILHEIKGQLGPLARQANKAQRYREYQQALQANEVLLLAERYLAGKQRIQQLSLQVDKLRAEQAGALSRQSVGEAALEEQKLALTTLEQDLEALRLQDLELTRALEQCQAQLHLAEEKQDRWQAELIRSQKELAALTDSLIQAEADIEQRRAKLAEAVERAEQIAREVAAAGDGVRAAQARLSEASADAANAEQALFAALDRVKELESRIRVVETQGEQAAAESARLAEQIKAIDAELAEYQQEYAAKQVALRKAEDRLAALESRRQELVEAKADLEAQIKEQRHQTERCKEQLGRAESELRALRDLQESGEDLFAGVKQVVQAAQSGRLAGIIGVVADLLVVPRGYEVAIETALGSNIQCLVSIDDAAAEAAISWLKQHRAGRATFLPLNIISGRPVPPAELAKLKETPGFLGLASEMVSAAANLAGLKDYLLGRCLLAEDLTTARKIAGQTQYRYQVVTVEGDLIRPGGSMTGGFQRQNTSGLLQRRGRISELAEQVAGMKSKLAQVTQTVAELAAAEERLAAELAGNDRQHTECRLEQVAVEKELAALKQSIEAAQKRREALRERIQSLTATQVAQTKAQLQAELVAANRAREQAQAALGQAKVKLQEAQAELDRQRALAGQVETAQAIEKEKLDRAEAELKQAVALQETLRGRINECQLLISQAEQEIAAAKAAIQRAGEAKERLEKDKQSIVGLYRQKRTAREALQAGLAENENKLRLLRREVANLTTELHEQELELTRLRSEQAALLERAQENYALTEQQVDQVDLTGVDLDEARAKVAEYQSKLKMLGAINPDAEAEYQAAKERFDFLTGQYNDLVQAKQDLDNVISEIETTTEEQFAATFAQIQKEFREMFARLFGGGEAFLTLTQPDNLTETGIEIMAQPPGKKLQNLALLSSGERSLTAISLLLAILKVNPAPFTILDEVDAALDDANLDRFGEVLREFAQRTQFIVITHRRATMELANMLYGVTMQKDKGYSEVVSVKLSDLTVG